MKQPQLYWLASYPKSGNTWTRSFINIITHTEKDDVDLNDLRTGAIASSRTWLENALGFSLDSLNNDEIDALRPAAFRYINGLVDELGYHKCHDAFTQVGVQQEPMFPAEVTRGVLHIVRNPLDVCISFANHLQCSIDDAIRRMGHTDFCLSKSHKGQNNQVRQRLLTWSQHVSSWQNSGLPLLTVRYEDMRADSFNTFTKMATFLQLPNSADEINRALELTAFERLKDKEREGGFREKPFKVESFFRKGIVGDWKQTLTTQQIDQVVHDHHAVMAEFGYLP